MLFEYQSCRVFSQCSKNCEGGVKSREVQCFDMRDQRQLRPFHCRAMSSRPQSQMPCNLQPCLDWYTSSWGQVSHMQNNDRDCEKCADVYTEMCICICKKKSSFTILPFLNRCIFCTVEIIVKGRHLSVHITAHICQLIPVCIFYNE